MEMGISPGWTIYESPLGPLTVLAGPGGVTDLRFPEPRTSRLDRVERREMPAVTGQLDEYFAGERRQFDLELDLRGDPLQRLVWARLREIPYGTTVSYGELAGQIEESAYPEGLEPYKRVRLAAAAIGRTPTPIIVPCHRVIGADGSLTGYGGGLQRKQALLDLEGNGSGPQAPTTGPADPQMALL
jgi:methylated-DNA-[protein]-cysteine S-methyltransferase